jgi:hypothetical protein
MQSDSSDTCSRESRAGKPANRVIIAHRARARRGSPFIMQMQVCRVYSRGRSFPFASLCIPASERLERERGESSRFRRHVKAFARGRFNPARKQPRNVERRKRAGEKLPKNRQRWDSRVSHEIFREFLTSAGDAISRIARTGLAADFRSRIVRT